MVKLKIDGGRVWGPEKRNGFEITRRIIENT
jgi:hypothetical protein